MFIDRVRDGILHCRALPVVLIALCTGLGLLGSAAQAASAPKLLLLPIVVHSAEDPEYLRNGLADMLAARFSRIGTIELIRPKDRVDGTTDLDEALKRGRKVGADFVLFGSFTRFGQGASLDVQCAPTDDARARNPLREIFVHSGSIGEIIPDLDDLAGKVSRFALGENVSPAAPISSGFASGSADLQDVLSRVEALEAAFSEILETADDLTDTDG